MPGVPEEKMIDVLSWKKHVTKQGLGKRALSTFGRDTLDVEVSGSQPLQIVTA
jgi:hypothetical protein